MSTNIIGIPALQSNYIWMIYDNTNDCIIIDPGESIRVLNILKKLKLSLKAILLTHNHYDHIDGVNKLIQFFPKATVYGPQEIQHCNINYTVSEGDNILLLNKKFKVFNFTGHTKNHIGFYYNNNLFCGDTVFSAGCGKIQIGLEKQMYESFLKIKNFPDNTLIYSGHEYTLSNINFVSSMLPYNNDIINYKNKITNLKKLNKTTIPTTLKLELKINPFFYCNNIDLKKALGVFPKSGEEWKIFYTLRKKKDEFNKKQCITK